MLDPAKVSEIRRLLAAKLDQRAVARRAGVSRSTVQAIASGRRADKERLVPAPSGPVVRCQCGALAQLPGGQAPCLACRVRLRTATGDTGDRAA